MLTVRSPFNNSSIDDAPFFRDEHFGFNLKFFLLFLSSW